jgi:hypothetical protein
LWLIVCSIRMPSTSSDLFTHVVPNAEGAALMHMQRTVEASLLWADSEESAGSADDYAVSVGDPRTGSSAPGYADRYGGVGIINNGGAGRGAYYRGRYLKGIGRTPLIGVGQRDWHSDGLLFVEEAARECILGNIAAFEFPWGGVRPTAVIDTGVRSDLGYRDPATNINRTLVVVRKPALRLAHLERALLYRGEEVFCGFVDEQRVRGNIARAIGRIGRESVLRTYIEGWYRWAEQCAYQFIHRIPQTSPSTSNVAIDGQLIDFGGSRALPCWSAYIPGAGLAPFGTEMAEIIRFLHSGGRDVLRRIAVDDDPAALSTFVERECLRRYSLMLVRQFLRLVGFRSVSIDDWMSSPSRSAQLTNAVNSLLKKYQSRHSYEMDWPADEMEWILPRFWDPTPPAALKPLREICDTLGCKSEPLVVRSRLRTRSRPMLNYNALSKDIYAALKVPAAAGHYGTEFQRYVAKATTSNRRDSWSEPALATPVGFISAGYQSFAIFRDRAGVLEAYLECPCDGLRRKAPLPKQILELSSNELVLEGGESLGIDAAELSL